MAQPSQTDLVKGVDCIALSTVSTAQLNQLVDSGTPYTDKGLVVETTDIATVPQVPDANAHIKWKKYLWKRQQASGVVGYFWDANAVPDGTFLNWVAITVASIADGSITTTKLADNAVTDSKITSVSYSKLVGAPGSLPPSGVASGDLTGPYPGPTVGANKITDSKLSSDAAIDANRAVGTNHIKARAVTGLKLGVDLAGIIMPFAGTTIPDGWLACDGASYLRADYADLSAVLSMGATFPWGAADGTHFNVPDLRGRTLIGDGTGPANYLADGNPILTARVIATAKGRETHTLVVGEVPTPTGSNGIFCSMPGAAGNITVTTGAGTDHKVLNSYAGGAHNNMQPVAVIKWIIKT